MESEIEGDELLNIYTGRCLLASFSLASRRMSLASSEGTSLIRASWTEGFRKSLLAEQAWL